MLDQRIKAEIKALETEKREHQAGLLQDEEKRLETLVKELRSTTDTDLVTIARLEERLIQIEYRVDNEVN